jgi:hypothetical protein
VLVTGGEPDQVRSLAESGVRYEELA